MRSAVLLTLIGLAHANAAAEEWHEVKSKEHGFKVSFPGEPKPPENDEQEASDQAVWAYASKRLGAAFMLVYTHQPNGKTSPSRVPQQQFALWEAVMTASGYQRVRAEKPSTVHGLSAKRVTFETTRQQTKKPLVMQSRMIIGDSRKLQQIVTYPKDKPLPQKHVEKFFDSFQPLGKE